MKILEFTEQQFRIAATIRNGKANGSLSGSRLIPCLMVCWDFIPTFRAGL